MSSILVDKKELAQGQDVFNFLKNLSPETQKSIKAIICWENLKQQEEPESA